MRLGDVAYCGREREDASFTFRAANGSDTFRILPSVAWGIHACDPNEVGVHLADLVDAVHMDRGTWASTASAYAGRFMRHATKLRQLRPRWRALAHAAIHQGPTVVLRGGAPDARAWDRTHAFLTALDSPMPVPGTWVAIQDPTWKAIRRCTGLVRATVRIPEHPYHLPPLPVRVSGATIHPVGLVRGVWTIAMLRDAVEHGGVEPVAVHEAAVCLTAPIHAGAAVRIRAIASKTLRKLVYTRYWGRMCSTGGWMGTTTPPDHAPKHRIHRFRDSSLYWTWNGHEVYDHTCPPDYRPDHAAFVTSDNHVAMNRALRGFGPNEVIAAHIDAIWTDRESPAPPGPDFRIKGEGPCRFWGVGTYSHGEKLAAQGWPRSKVLTSASLEAWGRKVDNGDGLIRSYFWHGLPRETIEAKSDPVHWEARHLPPLPHPNVNAPCWTLGGWYKNELESTPEVLNK
jgi:hypothetical protein